MATVQLVKPCLQFHFLKPDQLLVAEHTAAPSIDQQRYHLVLGTLQSYRNNVFYRLWDTIKYYLPCFKSDWTKSCEAIDASLKDRIQAENWILTNTDARVRRYNLSEGKTNQLAKQMLNQLWSYYKTEDRDNDSASSVTCKSIFGEQTLLQFDGNKAANISLGLFTDQGGPADFLRSLYTLKA